jgi:hypothetical protein
MSESITTVLPVIPVAVTGPRYDFFSSYSADSCALSIFPPLPFRLAHTHATLHDYSGVPE